MSSGSGLKTKEKQGFRNLELNPEEVKQASQEAKFLLEKELKEKQLRELADQKKANLKAISGLTATFPNRKKTVLESLQFKHFLLWVGIASAVYYAVSRGPDIVHSVRGMDWTNFEKNIISMSPEGLRQAYAYNNVQQTTFDASGLGGTADEQAYLTKLFKITDEGVIRRIWAMAKVAGYINTAHPPQIQLPTIEDIKLLTPPESLREVHEKIIQALEIQNSFFKDFTSTGQLQSDPRVGQSDSPLRQAYSLLLGRFPNASAAVKQSFYSHLCALSLI